VRRRGRAWLGLGSIKRVVSQVVKRACEGAGGGWVYKARRQGLLRTKELDRNWLDAAGGLECLPGSLRHQGTLSTWCRRSAHFTPGPQLPPVPAIALVLSIYTFKNDWQPVPVPRLPRC
jgi:hypothetical protein